MATCHKCGKGNIKKRNGVKKCKSCGPLPGYEDLIIKCGENDDKEEQRS